jgi:CMP-N,N'-diacetyllegionaminic acid synthase
MLAGKPLVAWTIEAACRSAHIDRLILSTDDEEISDVARHWGCEVPFLRPAHLGADNVQTVDVVKHALTTIGGSYEYVMQLQPTSPLRSTEDIDGAIRLCIERAATSCISVAPAKPGIHLMCRIGHEGRLETFVPLPKGRSRRQDLPDSYVINGAVYLSRSEWLKSCDVFIAEHTAAYVMPRSRSFDIDSEDDLAVIEALLEKKLLRIGG